MILESNSVYCYKSCVILDFFIGGTKHDITIRLMITNLLVGSQNNLLQDSNGYRTDNVTGIIQVNGTF